MNRDSKKGLSQSERREWARPTVRSLNAGSAELDVGPNDDGPNDVS